MRRFMMVVGILACLQACGGGGTSPVAPPPVTTPPTTQPPPEGIGNLTLTPPSGSTVKLGHCGTHQPSTCTTAMRGSVDIALNSAVSQPVVGIRFYQQNGKECLFDFPLGFTGSWPGTRTYAINFFSLNGCATPFTTRYLIVKVNERTVNGATLIERRFNASHTWTR